MASDVARFRQRVIAQASQLASVRPLILREGSQPDKLHVHEVPPRRPGKWVQIMGARKPRRIYLDGEYDSRLLAMREIEGNRAVALIVPIARSTSTRSEFTMLMREPGSTELVAFHIKDDTATTVDPAGANTVMATALASRLGFGPEVRPSLARQFLGS